MGQNARTGFWLTKISDVWIPWRHDEAVLTPTPSPSCFEDRLLGTDS